MSDNYKIVLSHQLLPYVNKEIRYHIWTNYTKTHQQALQTLKIDPFNTTVNGIELFPSSLCTPTKLPAQYDYFKPPHYIDSIDTSSPPNLSTPANTLATFYRGLFSSSPLNFDIFENTSQFVTKKITSTNSSSITKTDIWNKLREMNPLFYTAKENVRMIIEKEGYYMSVMSIGIEHSSPASVYQDKVCVALYGIYKPDPRMVKTIYIPMNKIKDDWKIDLSNITFNGISIYAPDDVFASQSIIKELDFEIEKTIDLKPSFNAYMRRAYYFAGDHKYDSALENCEEALSIKPMSKEALSLKDKLLKAKEIRHSNSKMKNRDYLESLNNLQE
jgi:hypothetical protein